jgi:hypothetical protein
MTHVHATWRDFAAQDTDLSILKQYIANLFALPLDSGSVRSNLAFGNARYRQGKCDSENGSRPIHTCTSLPRHLDFRLCGGARYPARFIEVGKALLLRRNASHLAETCSDIARADAYTWGRPNLVTSVGLDLFFRCRIALWQSFTVRDLVQLRPNCQTPITLQSKEYSRSDTAIVRRVKNSGQLGNARNANMLTGDRVWFKTSAMGVRRERRRFPTGGDRGGGTAVSWPSGSR